MPVFKIFVEKKPEFAYEADSLAADLRGGPRLEKVSAVRIINRYFAEDISREDFEAAKNTIFAEPPVDIITDEQPDFGDARIFAAEYLPGQFDQRADSCAQCISLATGGERPRISTAKLYAIYGGLNDEEFAKAKAWIINPVESREASFAMPATLAAHYPPPRDIEILDGFISQDMEGLKELCKAMSLAMDIHDLQFCQQYFRAEEKRDPTLTELRVLDTYWSDHCRHTTFLTELDKVEVEDAEIQRSWERYLALKKELGRAEKPVTLMDLATIGARALKARGLLADLDESEEINACSVKIKADVGGKEQDWLLMFKNETHNHPTEIEPFGGAATCLGGAIRDPLSGRSFVYQAMRVTGAASPLTPAEETLSGKLPQLKLCRTAAAGYSSYGNQIGLATGHVHEIYHSGYAAKRMEIGAVIGAAPAENVIRMRPEAGDVVILLGGRTGRDGCGGATGSSKSHDSKSIETCGAEVQKGNAPEERKLQRLFRNPAATRLIKRCNDFGAGGVSVSIGELADGLVIDLDKVPKKYEGLDGTELAISESQERMSVVVAKGDAESFIALAAGENLEATAVAEITEAPRLVMNWRSKPIVNISREFLNSNGAAKHTEAHIEKPEKQAEAKTEFTAEELAAHLASLKYCSQKGLVERFDSIIGAATVTMPFGGAHQLTPTQAMAAKIPALNAETNTCSLMAWGFDAEISTASPYHGAVFAVTYSLAKIIASGGSRKKCWLTFQEYFERLGEEAHRWGKPAAALLGALDAQMGLEIAAIGGKDSMSGSFEKLDVPPTLVSFAVAVTKQRNIVTPEFKRAGSFVYVLRPKKQDFAALRAFFDETERVIAEESTLSVWALGTGGTAEAVVKMCLGNKLGFEAAKPLAAGGGFGGFVLETALEPTMRDMIVELLGKTVAEYMLKTPLYGVPLEKLQHAWEQTLEPVYPCLMNQGGEVKRFTYGSGVAIKPQARMARPEFVIPVFPGTNSEYDTARAIEKAGGVAKVMVIRNLTAKDIAESVDALAVAIDHAQAIVIPGGFSGGDEPDGSGKFITAFFRNAKISGAVAGLLQKRDGLMCGICNGFQALIKLGLVPYGEIRNMNESSPTLTFNKIGRHQSTLVRTRICSNKSPWLSHLELGGSYLVPISHGEGRFIASGDLIAQLAANGQIATQYVDLRGEPTQDIRFNPNNSDFAIEGITSPDGRVFGRMGHNERYDDGLFKNVPDTRKMDIFAGAVGYFN